MMKVLIVDDEPPARRRIRRLLSGHPDIRIVGECRNGAEAVKAIRTEAPDLIFLDVQMPGMDGFDVLRRLDEKHMPAVVFVTAYDQYAVRAFDVHALDYLLKPFDEERFAKTLRRAREQVHDGLASPDRSRLLKLLASLSPRSPREARLLIRDRGKTLFVPLDTIEWIESAGNYCIAHTPNGKQLLRRTMKALEEALSPDVFRRVHRRAIVNIQCIKELRSWGEGEYELILASGAKVPVSRRYRRHLDEAL
ncbi:MAG: response regulator [Candidatus Zixiibacteriota bacterium]